MSSEPQLLVEVTRGESVESRHYGHAVVVDVEGRILFAAGDPERPTYPRSALKPLQALAGLSRGTAERFELTDAEVAVTCASHAAEPRHRAAVQAILDKIRATEEDLRCGPHPVPDPESRDELIRAGKKPTRIYNNCSGKHSGMLALARVLEAPLSGYWEAKHPVQKEIQRILAEACGTDLAGLTWGVDGCGVPTYLMPLYQLALGFARLATPRSLPEADQPAARRIVAAMSAEPGMVSGKTGFDTILMQALSGVVISKGGAEGCQGIGLVGRGIGIAVKLEDGNPRGLPPIALELLRRFEALPGTLPDALAPYPEVVVQNTREQAVGSIRTAGPLRS